MNKTEDKHSTSLLSRLAYGAADIYGGGAFVVIGTFFTVFLTKALGMAPALAGTIPLIGKVWDAVTDPLMGNITDRTQSKFGAKRFYLLIGSVVSAVTFIAMWISFPISATAGQYLFYMLMYMLFSTGFTIVMVPYNALLPDMVEDYVTRSKFSGVRIACSSFGAILAGLIPTLLIKDNTDPAPYLTVALIFGVIFLAVILATFFGTWEKQKAPVKVGFKESFVQSFTVYKSRSFKLFIGIFICGQAAADFVTGLAVYYVDDVLNAYGGGRFTYIGLGMSASSVSIFAILTDMADVDELITSINRPGICSGMATFARKIAAGLSSAIIGLLLTAVGYSEVIASQGGRQAASTQQGIALIYVFVPVVLMVLTLVFAQLFPLHEKEFAAIKREIARRKGEDSSKATPEEIAVCERVTGFSYDRLWNRDNALRLGGK